jgi:hypothetical protein
MPRPWCLDISGTLSDALPDSPFFLVICARPSGDFIQRAPTPTAPRFIGVDLANVITGRTDTVVYLTAGFSSSAAAYHGTLSSGGCLTTGYPILPSEKPPRRDQMIPPLARRV